MRMWSLMENEVKVPQWAENLYAQISWSASVNRTSLTQSETKKLFYMQRTCTPHKYDQII